MCTTNITNMCMNHPTLSGSPTRIRIGTTGWSIPTITPPIFTISTGMTERKFPQIIRNRNDHKGRKEHKGNHGNDKTLPTALRRRFPLVFL